MKKSYLAIGTMISAGDDLGGRRVLEKEKEKKRKRKEKRRGKLLG
jgi:hypothetical protein